MTIKNKLITLLLAALLGLLVLGGSSVLGLSRTLTAIEDIGDNRMPSVEALLQLKEAVTDLSRAMYQGSAATFQPSQEAKNGELKSALKRRIEAAKRAQAAIAVYEALPADAEEQALWKATKSSWDAWLAYELKGREINQQAVDHPSQESPLQMAESTVKITQERRAISGKLYEQLDAVIAYNKKAAQASAAEAETTAQRAKQWQFGTLLVLVVGLSVMGWMIFRAIMGPLARAQETVQAIAASNDLTRRVGYRANDEIGGLVRALDAMLENMQQSLRSIQQNMSSAQSAVSNLNTAAAEVAASSATQSGAASSMAASIEELTVSISSVSSSADDANRLAQESAHAASDGSASIEQTVEEMNAIDNAVSRASQVIGSLGEESQRISAVVQVIKEVADQTNLLALNAAIEAARAGEQGRGFAVVADEVRKLAERTTQSTQDIAAMIGAIQASSNQAVQEMERVVENVATGKQKASEAGSHIDDIRNSAARVTASVSEISNALQEQSIASTEIAKYVESIAQMTEENHTASGHAADTAMQVEQMANEVSTVIGRFRV